MVTTSGKPSLFKGLWGAELPLVLLSLSWTLFQDTRLLPRVLVRRKLEFSAGNPNSYLPLKLSL